MAKRKNQGGYSARQAAEAAARRKEAQNKSIARLAGILSLVVVVILGITIYFSLQEDEVVTPITAGTVIDSERPLAELEPAERVEYYSEAPATVIDTSKEYEAIVRTEKGDMRFRLFDDQTPTTVNNFVFLANQGYYDNTSFHRVLDGFMAQAGDPTGTGVGGPGYSFADEFDRSLRFDRPGLLAMANAGPGTNGSQFFITLAPTEWLNDAHTIFGEIIEGEDVLNSIRLRDPGSDPEPGDMIERIDIVEGG